MTTMTVDSSPAVTWDAGAAKPAAPRVLDFTICAVLAVATVGLLVLGL